MNKVLVKQANTKAGTMFKTLIPDTEDKVHNDHKKVLFQEGNWGILSTTNNKIYRKYTESCIFHKCPGFPQGDPHHWYHNINFDVTCAMCDTKWPESVATLWRLQNFDIISTINYILIFVEAK